MSYTLLKQSESFGGKTLFAEHQSSVVKTPMKFSAFYPNNKVKNCIIWLSGLTCNEENFISKAGAQSYLENTDTMIICPDTSPRGLDLPGEHDSYDFGSGAGFYLNATSKEYENNYRMYDYITKELYSLIQQEFNISNISIMGHSMGGHGALVMGLRNPEKFKSISAFSPIVNPSATPWGIKAFKGYLGDEEESWKEYDATELVLSGKNHPNMIMIEQGLGDEFFKKELKTENFVSACEKKGQKLEVHYRENYDHSYYFISTFIKQHIQFHLNHFDS